MNEYIYKNEKNGEYYKGFDDSSLPFDRIDTPDIMLALRFTMIETPGPTGTRRGIANKYEPPYVRISFKEEFNKIRKNKLQKITKIK